MLAVTGFRTSIVRALSARTGEPVVRIHGALDQFGGRFVLPAGSERFVLAAGVLYPRQVHTLDEEQIRVALAVNLVSVIRLTEHILHSVPRARVVIVGSVSGRDGSFDQLYAVAKAGVHAYVQTRLVQPPQLLFCVAPTIVSDAGMTTRRADYPAVLSHRLTVSSMQVAEKIAAALYAADHVLERLNNRVFFLEGTQRL